MSQIRLPATCIAELAYATPGARASKLRPYKYSNRGEGAGRSAYYKGTRDTVREYHRSQNNTRVLRQAIERLTAIENDLSLPRQTRTKARKNIEALYAYEDLYGARKFTVMPNHFLALEVGSVTIKAQPDLWVSENGTEVLIKIGVAKNRSADQVDLLLHLIRKAAIKTGYKIRARNVVYLNTKTGEEVISHRPLNYFNRTIVNTCHAISGVWQDVRPPVPRQRPVTSQNVNSK
ncbi:MAG TPA: hypothetical protein VK738_21345 [Terriglobales bacterium]|jgi:hypothetical protein|nr:hypothetical protein [Terriglobales bacterium]